MCSDLSDLDCDIITGGGPGLMQAANEGAKAGQMRRGGESIGIRVHLPFEQTANAFVEQVFEHETSRLHQFVLMSDAYIVAPGGIGTVLESVMVCGNPYRSDTSTIRRSFSRVRCGKAL